MEEAVKELIPAVKHTGRSEPDSTQGAPVPSDSEGKHTAKKTR